MQRMFFRMETAHKLICVLLVVDDLGYGGAERQLVELANNMDFNRFDVHICTLSDHLPLRNQLKDLENNLHVIARKFRFDFTVVLRLAWLLRKLNADIVHGYLYSAEIASRFESLVLLGSLAVVSESKNKAKIFHYSAVVSSEEKSQFRRCHSLPSPRALGGKNKLYVR